MRRFAWWVWLHLWMLLWPARRDQERLRIRLLREAEGLARSSTGRALPETQVRLHDRPGPGPEHLVELGLPIPGGNWGVAALTFACGAFWFAIFAALLWR